MKILGFNPLTASVALLVCASLLACSAQRNTPPPVYIHTVSVQGETLGLIADWYTGSSQNWRSIAANNPSLNPNRLRLGDQVMIPESMTTRTDPLTKKYVESATRRRSGLGDTFAKTTTPDSLPMTGSNTNPPATDNSTSTASLAPSEGTPSSDTTDSSAGVRAAEEATAVANQASAEAAQQVAAQGGDSANSDQAVEAAKQAQVAAEEAAARASAAAADAAAKASESAQNTVAQATSDTAAVAADSAISAPASDRPKTKDELLKELLEDK